MSVLSRILKFWFFFMIIVPLSQIKTKRKDSSAESFVSKCLYVGQFSHSSASLSKYLSGKHIVDCVSSFMLSEPMNIGQEYSSAIKFALI